MLLHPIDPLVDCVFKSLFGDPANKELLLSFLNAVLRPEHPLSDVEILNPFSPAEYVGDDLRVVDVRVRDGSGTQYQVEMQLVVGRWLASRIVYTWADLYQGQLQRGEPFAKLRPVVSIWVLASDLLPGPHWHHRFRLWDASAEAPLSDHAEIHTLELRKWRRHAEPLAADESWIYFLREGHRWHELPADLRQPILEKAMRVLERFSEKGEDYQLYQSRMNYRRQQASIEAERAETEAALAQARADLAETQGTLAETQGTLAETQGTLAETQGTLAEAQGTLAETSAELERANKELEELRARLRAMEG